MKRFLTLLLPSALLAAVAFTFTAAQQPQPKDKDKKKPPVREYNSGIVWEEPKPTDPGPVGGPPADAVVLFNGKDMSAWKGAEKWEIKDGHGIAKSAATSKQHFGDCQLHLEWASPLPVKGSGQGRGNNGVKLMGRYEIQILDSYENKTYLDGMCAALYKQRPPLVNACRKPGEWQSFDILFTAPRFDDKGELRRPAYVTLLHNGVLVHNHVEIQGTTAYDRPPKYTPHAEKGPILLAYHGQPVRFRNIWVREFRELESKAPPALKDGSTPLRGKPRERG